MSRLALYLEFCPAERIGTSEVDGRRPRLHVPDAFESIFAGIENSRDRKLRELAIIVVGSTMDTHGLWDVSSERVSDWKEFMMRMMLAQPVDLTEGASWA